MTRENESSVRLYMNWLALDGMPEFPCGAMQAGSGRINEPRDADTLAREARDAGLECVTLHLGWGLEDDDDAVRL